MSASTLRTSLFALVLFAIAGYLGYNHWVKPVDPDNGNLILDKDANMSGAAADLARVGGLGASATPADVAKLVAALKDTDPNLRVEAAMALGKVPPADPEVLKSLNEATKDTDPGVRLAALIGLDDQSRAAKEANSPYRVAYETTVLTALKDPTARVRRTAVTSLRGRPEGSLTRVEEIARAEIAALDDVDPPTRIAAVAALHDLPSIAGTGLDANTVNAFIDEVPAALKLVANADLRFRPDYQGLVRTIAETVSKKAKAPVSADQAKSIREAFAAGLSDKRVDARRAVVDVFTDVAPLAGTDAERADLIRPLLKDGDAQVRGAAYRALWASPVVAQPEGKATRDELREMTRAWIAELSKPESTDRELAAWLLSWTDREDADAAIAALSSLKDDKSEPLKKRAARSLEALESAKKSEAWPEPAWKPFRSGPPGQMAASGG